MSELREKLSQAIAYPNCADPGGMMEEETKRALGVFEEWLRDLAKAMLLHSSDCGLEISTALSLAADEIAKEREA